ncbi:MAG: hypothetical protein MZU97_14190 [Bacillus subtilis]|nr:hypothetical protein [Bacillus subtilis]
MTLGGRTDDQRWERPDVKVLGRRMDHGHAATNRRRRPLRAYDSDHGYRI